MRKKSIWLVIIFLIAIFSILKGAWDKEVKDFRIASSIYVGWMPWYLAAEENILKEKSDKFGISIEFVPADYIESINLFIAGHADAVTVTNIDALAIVAAANVEADIILISSFSNGNDAIFLNDKDKSLQDVENIGLVPFSVSHYLLDRVMDLEGISTENINVVSVNDPDIAGAYFSESLDGVVTWNPIALQLEDGGATRKYDSKFIHKEIADVLLVRRSALKESAEFGDALLETWFSASKGLSSNKSTKIDRLGTLSGSNGESYRKQLETTLLMDEPQKAIEELTNGNLVETAQYTYRFIERHELARDMSIIEISDHDAKEKAMISINSGPLTRYLQSNQKP